MLERMSIPGNSQTGRIESLHFAHLLARFWAEGFTGAFRARGSGGHAGKVTREIFFERGRVAWAASDDPQESIRTYLLNRGILRNEQWHLAQEKAGAAHPRQSLLDMGFLSARELQDADRERVSGIVLSLFNWSEGEYATAASSLPPGTPSLKIDPRDLVLEGIMSSGDRDRVLAEIGSLDAVLVVRPDDLVRASLSLPVELVDLMGRADGTRSVAEICALSPLSDFMISAAFAALKILGLAAPAEKGAGAAPPAPPRPAPLGVSRSRPRRGSLNALEYDPPPRLPLANQDPGSAIELGDGSARQEARREIFHEEAGTIPMEATPPAGTRSMEAPMDPQPAHEQEEPEPGTQPMAATPPGGMPAVIDENSPDDENESHDDSGTRPMTATPRSGTPSVNASSPWSDEDLDGRVGEEDLSPGIPIPDQAEAEISAARERDEIEAAVDLFSDEGRRLDGESLAGSGDGEEPPGLAPGMEEAPTWIFEPPAAQAAGSHGRSRWVTWGGMAAGLFAVGTVLTIVFGGGGDTPAPEPDPATLQAHDEAPPAVDIPVSSEAAQRLPEAPQEAAEPTAPAVKPPPATVSMATQEAPPELARPQSGGILGSVPFGDGRSRMSKGHLREAARSFQTGLTGKNGLYTVQLALACREETVARAVKTSGGAQEFFILPREFNGRACYRVLWGTYPGRAAAEKGLRSIPGALTSGGDKPFVAPI